MPLIKMRSGNIRYANEGGTIYPGERQIFYFIDKYGVRNETEGPVHKEQGKVESNPPVNG